MVNLNVTYKVLSAVPMFAAWAAAALKDGKIDLNEAVQLLKDVADLLGVELAVPVGTPPTDKPVDG